MNRFVRRPPVPAVLLLGLCMSLWGPKAEADCGSFATAYFAGFSYIDSPGANTPASIESAFWAFGFGNPSLGVGADNGGWADTEPTADYPQGWLRSLGPVNYLSGSWSASPEVNGCITGQISPGKPREIMVAAYSDQDPPPWSTQNRGYFAITAIERRDGGPPDYLFLFGGGGGDTVNLAPIPKPIILSSSRDPSGDLILTLRGPTFAQVSAGIYTDGTAPAAELVLGYRVYAQPVPPSAPEPTDRRRDAGWELVADMTPMGQNVTFTIPQPCRFTYLALSLVFESGFETAHVSQNGPPVQTHICDPAFDFDGDGYSFNPCCPDHDCVDDNPAIHPFAPEVCNGVDDNCDGAIDEDVDGGDSDSDGIPNACDDCVTVSDPAQHDFDGDGQGNACDLDDGLILIRFDVPIEVNWQAEAGFIGWNLYEGDLAVLASTGQYTQPPGSNDLARRVCDLPSPGAPDPGSPGTGLVAYFLVSGETVTGEGSLGTDSEGIERNNSAPCP